MIPFNINDYVYAKLTDAGKAIAHEQLAKYEEFDGGWSKWQLWELMAVFGSSMYNGCDVPFETNIRIDSGYTNIMSSNAYEKKLIFELLDDAFETPPYEELRTLYEE